MKSHLPNFNHLHIFVVGDIMLDRNLHGETSRISPEAPVPVVHINTIEERPGGAGNVALNIAEIGAKVSLFSVCGNDDSGNTLEQKLKAAKIETHIEKCVTLQTTTKQRVLSRHQQLIRLDFEKFHSDYDLSKTIDVYSANLSEAQVVIFSDYGKGMAIKAQDFIQLAKQKQIPIVVDPKGNDFSIYQGATLLTPNRKEFEAVVGNCHSEEEMQAKALKLIEALNLSALLVTRGEQGMTLFRPGLPKFHLPAQAHEIYDVTGAGDTVAAFLAMMIAAGEDLPSAAKLANIAAGIVVGKLGAATVELSELNRALIKEHLPNRGIIDESTLATARQHAKMRGERIVMTNGCFDILHAGHIAYLEEAKALGDRLIVAVNDDASVARLKGDKRPINTLEHRMAVLAGLSAVDWVIPFSEDTPERLINHILPDVLVKGGDYQADEIAGANAVASHGGVVKILQFMDGCSTTKLIRKIQQEIA